MQEQLEINTILLTCCLNVLQILLYNINVLIIVRLPILVKLKIVINVVANFNVKIYHRIYFYY